MTDTTLTNACAVYGPAKNAKPPIPEARAIIRAASKRSEDSNFKLRSSLQFTVMQNGISSTINSRLINRDE